MSNSLTELKAADSILEEELISIKAEMPTLTHREMQRQVWIKNRIDAIGKERLALFMERRKIYNGEGHDVPASVQEKKPVRNLISEPIPEPLPINQSWTLF